MSLHLAEKLTPMVRYSLVICRNNLNKYLCVQQRTGKWWIPGGALEKGETHYQAAIRQTKEQAGIDVKLKGILAIDHVDFGISAIRLIYYAQPLNEFQVPKQKADKESKRALFLTLPEILQRKQIWRNNQILHYPQYLEQGGGIFPLQVFKQSIFLYDSDER